MSIFVQDEILIEEGGKGLDLEIGSYPVVVWGIVPFRQHDFNDKDKEVGGLAIAVQFPTEKDEKGKPKVGWVISSDFLSADSKFHKYIKGIFGRPIASNDPLRVSEGGGLDPKKIYGKNCIAAVQNVSKVEGTERIGIQSFSPSIKKFY